MTLYDPWQHPNATHEQHLAWNAESWRLIQAGHIDLPRQPVPDYQGDPDPESLPDAPRMSRNAQRDLARTPLLRVNADGWGNDGRFHGREGHLM